MIVSWWADGSASARWKCSTGSHTYLSRVTCVPWVQMPTLRMFSSFVIHLKSRVKLQLPSPSLSPAQTHSWLYASLSHRPRLPQAMVQSQGFYRMLAAAGRDVITHLFSCRDSEGSGESRFTSNRQASASRLDAKRSVSRRSEMLSYDSFPSWITNEGVACRRCFTK